MSRFCARGGTPFAAGVDRMAGRRSAGFAIAVGSPVTGRPPRRSRRAVFPHRARLQRRAATFWARSETRLKGGLTDRRRECCAQVTMQPVPSPCERPYRRGVLRTGLTPVGPAPLSGSNAEQRQNSRMRARRRGTSNLPERCTRHRPSGLRVAGWSGRAIQANQAEAYGGSSGVTRHAPDG